MAPQRWINDSPLNKRQQMKHEHLDLAMAAALRTRLRNKGHRIATTVAPKAWDPMDPALKHDAEQERAWTRSTARQ